MNITHLLFFFKNRNTLTRSEILEPMQPVFQEGMELLVDVGFVSCYRTSNGKINTVVLTELGEQRVNELVRVGG